MAINLFRWLAILGILFGCSGESSIQSDGGDFRILKRDGAQKVFGTRFSGSYTVDPSSTKVEWGDELYGYSSSFYPAGAVSESTEFSYSWIEDAEYIATFLPDHEFHEDVHTALSYEGADYTDPRKIILLYRKDETEPWIKVPSENDTFAKQIKFKRRRNSQYALAEED